MTPLEAGEGGGELRGRDAVAAGRGPDRQRVRDVVAAGERQGDLDLAGLLVVDAEPARLGQRLDPAQRMQVVAGLQAVEEGAAAGAGGQLAHLGGVAAGDQEAVRGEQREQPRVGVPERLRSRVEVGVVVLGAGQQQRLGLVVEELGAAVEVGGVVLVPLDDEAVAGAVVEARRQVLGRAADQVAGIAAAGGVDPGGHRGRRRLAVGAGDHQRAVVVEEEAGRAPAASRRWARPSRSAATASGLSRWMALPMITRSGRGSRWAGS